MINIIITAPRGKMDRLIVKAVAECNDIKIIGGIGVKGREYIGKDVGIVAGIGYEVGAYVYDNIEDIIENCDMVVDFSTTALSMEVLESCIKHKKAFICGTTGFSEEEQKKLLLSANEIPFLKAANTSYVVNVMNKLLKIAAKALQDKAKIDIIDYHDAKKVDAPSGTAKELATEMAEYSGKDISEIDFHSIRAGDLSSSHTIFFGCMGECLEITHRAYTWDCYAIGACEGIRFLYGKEKGLYTMKDIIDI